MRPGSLFTWPLTRYKDHTAIVFKNKRLSFSQVDARINALSNGLLSLGLTTGQKVAVLLNNSIESVITLFGVPRSGLTYISLNARHSPQEHAAILNDSGADTLIIGEEFTRDIKSAMGLVSGVKHVLVAGRAERDWLSLEEIIAKQPTARPDIDVDYKNDIERIQYTSGTTGKPKGVIWTYGVGYNVITNTLINMDDPIGPGTINLNIGPLTHAAGLMMMIYYSKGATNVILPGFDEKAVLTCIERERVTSLLLIPTMFYRLLSFPGIESYDLSSIKRIWYGTAPMSANRLKEGIRIFGNVFRQNYGMTEIAQPITYLGPEDHVIDGTEIQNKRMTSAGKPAMGVELKIVNNDGKEVMPGEIGEIVLRSNKLMKGYWNLPEETEKSIQDGWFHTRDMATSDDDGYIYIVDRKSDMIISGGFNIYPREVEEVIMSYPGVVEAAVFGIPDEQWGESVKAVVASRQGAELTEDEIIQHCKEHLAGYKKPKSVDFIEEIPKNTYGKIDRRSLKSPYWEGFDRFVH
jgi:acyl-CoA synthetase (AMP-forming)/AMP-acid ligase II